jgi:hypothetical protein
VPPPAPGQKSEEGAKRPRVVGPHTPTATPLTANGSVEEGVLAVRVALAPQCGPGQSWIQRHPTPLVWAPPVASPSVAPRGRRTGLALRSAPARREHLRLADGHVTPRDARLAPHQPAFRSVTMIAIDVATEATYANTIAVSRS